MASLIANLPRTARELETRQIADAPASCLAAGVAGLTADALLLLYGRLGADPGICARRPVVGFRLVLARLLSIAAL
jgi:hypothetical protein